MATAPSFSLSLILLLLNLINNASSVPSEEMCTKLSTFIEQWHSDQATSIDWLSKNCYRIRQRPNDMSCADLIQFTRDCQYAGSQQQASENYSKTLSSITTNTLHKYGYYNRQTALDYGQFGNWYYPNYYPWHEISGLYGTPRAQAAQLENEWRFTKGANHPYDRSDNLVNQALMRTMLPTCLHDVIYCAKIAAAQRQAGR